MEIQTKCAEHGCDRPRKCKGMCRMHYMRTYKRKRYNSTPRSLWSTTIHPKSAHTRCRALWGPASKHLCVECGRSAQEWAYDGTDPTDLYRKVVDGKAATWTVFSRFPEFYMPMCLSCHRRRDQREVSALVHQIRLQKYGMVEGVLNG